MDVNNFRNCQSVANQNGLPGRMGAPLELIQELDRSISHSTDQRRSAMLRHLTDLYLVGSEQYSEDEIDLIDDVFVRLVSTIEQSARALLAIRLAPVMVAPPKILRVLACDNAIEVASPVLTQAARLDIDTLIQKTGTSARHFPPQNITGGADRSAGGARRPASRPEHGQESRSNVLR